MYTHTFIKWCRRHVDSFVWHGKTLQKVKRKVYCNTACNTAFDISVYAPCMSRVSGVTWRSYPCPSCSLSSSWRWVRKRSLMCPAEMSRHLGTYHLCTQTPTIITTRTQILSRRYEHDTWVIAIQTHSTHTLVPPPVHANINNYDDAYTWWKKIPACHFKCTWITQLNDTYNSTQRRTVWCAYTGHKTSSSMARVETEISSGHDAMVNPQTKASRTSTHVLRMSRSDLCRCPRLYFYWPYFTSSIHQFLQHFKRNYQETYFCM